MDGGGVHGGSKKTGSRKRPLELEQEEEGRETDKMFKCNYWEDPAHAYRVQLLGLHFARAAAVLNSADDAIRVAAACRASLRSLKAAPDEPAADS